MRFSIMSVLQDAGNELKERAGEDFFKALYAAIPAPAGAKLETKLTNIPLQTGHSTSSMQDSIATSRADPLRDGSAWMGGGTDESCRTLCVCRQEARGGLNMAQTNCVPPPLPVTSRPLPPLPLPNSGSPA